MKYYFIAGEASGDLHASNCMKRIKALDADAHFGFTGGSLMEEVSGTKADIHISEMAFMGFVDVLKNIRTINRNFKRAKKAILHFNPDLLVLVDYPGFNLRMAKWAHAQGIRTDFYISPTVWAWKEGRVEQIRKFVHKLFVILPFEEAFYAKHGMKVYFTGHPLIDAIEEQRPRFRTREEFIKDNGLTGRPLVAVLPGSRKQELDRMLQTMVSVSRQLPDCEFVFAGSAHLDRSFYRDLEGSGIKVIFNQTYELMLHARAGVIKSGTSTLESALLDLPQVVCYKGGGLSFAIGKRLVNVKYIGLPNLIMDKPVVKELIQDDFTKQNIVAELKMLLEDEVYRARILADYKTLRSMLGGPGASARVAAHLLEDARKR